MSTDRRTLEDWEKAECAALKAELDAFNAPRPRREKLTQEDIAHSLGMSQGTLSSHLNGHRAVNMEMAVAMSKMLGIPIERFSTRLAKEIAGIVSSISPSSIAVNQSPDVGSSALATGISRRSRSAFEKIAEAVSSGSLAEEDVVLLEMLASRLMSRVVEPAETPHQRVRKKLKENDPVPE